MNKTKIDEAVKQVLEELSDWLLNLPLPDAREDEETAIDVLSELSVACTHLRMQMPLWIAIGCGKDYQIAALRIQVEAEKLGRFLSSNGGDGKTQDAITTLSGDIDNLLDEVGDELNESENNS